MKSLIFLCAISILLLLCTGCSPEKRMQRAEQRIHNITERWPQLKENDTLAINDTIAVNGVTKDTVFQKQVMKDTVLLKKEKLKVRYHHTDSTVYLQGECQDDTVFYDRMVSYPVVKIRDPTWFNVVKRFNTLLWIVAALVIVGVILGIIKKIGFV